MQDHEIGDKLHLQETVYAWHRKQDYFKYPNKRHILHIASEVIRVLEHALLVKVEGMDTSSPRFRNLHNWRKVQYFHELYTQLSHAAIYMNY